MLLVVSHSTQPSLALDKFIKELIVDSKIGSLWLSLVFLALTGCVQSATIAPESPSPPPPLTITPTATDLQPSAVPPTESPTPDFATPTPDEPPGPPAPTLEPAPHPVDAAAPISGPLTITEIRMIDLSNGWALAQGDYPVEQVVRTEDGGLTWRLSSPPEPMPDLAGTVKVSLLLPVGAKEVWVTYQFQQIFQVPEAARVWMTTDGGETWQASRTLPITGDFEFYNLSDFQRSSDGSGWLMAHIGAGMNHDYIALFRSSPNGIDWKRVVDPFQTSSIQGCQKTGLDLLDRNLGWLGVDCQGVREGALFYETQDGGVTWLERQVEPPPQAENLFDRAFCGVYDPRLFTTTRGGFVLRCLLSDFKTREDYLYQTSTGGESWAVTPFPGGRVVVLMDEFTWALSRELHKSDDGGASWSFIKSVNWDGQFSFVDEFNGWAVAEAEEASALVRTDDGGQTWAIIEPQFINLAQ